MGLLIRGSVGDAVRALQESLDRAGYSSPDAPGVYGAGTEKAVRDFQDAYGLDADGKAGVDTMSKLDGVIGSLTPSDPAATDDTTTPAEPSTTDDTTTPADDAS
jgi:peptidoglycan hydrolase-like protein with peptidoglycan-binding domain